MARTKQLASEPVAVPVADPRIPHPGERWRLPDGRAVTVHAIYHRRAHRYLAVLADPDGDWIDATGAVPA
jgi:hypothetical protein